MRLQRPAQDRRLDQSEAPGLLRLASPPESAREQVAYEYEGALGQGVHVPPDVEDAHAFAVQYGRSG